MNAPGEETVSGGLVLGVVITQLVLAISGGCLGAVPRASRRRGINVSARAGPRVDAGFGYDTLVQTR
jgi:hypothetical protein